MISVILLAALAAAPTVSVEYRGNLREGLQEIARKGGINLVATGSLEEDAVIHLEGVTADEALTSVAAAYGLQLTHSGNLWIIRPGAAAALVPPVPPLLPSVSPPVPPSATSEEQARARIEAAQSHAQSEKDVVNLSGAVVVKENQRVDSAISYGGPVTIEKNARVDGDVVSFGGDVILQQDARVDGDAVSFGGKVIKAEGAKVKGEEVSFGGAGLRSVMASKAVKAARPDRVSSDSEGSAVARFFAWFAGLFGLGFLLMMFAPQRMKTIEAEMQQSPGKNGIAGLLATLASIPLTVFLCITLIGIPVAAAFWVLAALSTLVGLVAVANIVGSRMPVARLRRTQALALAAGLLLMLLVAKIPVAGPLLISIGALVSLGAIIRTRLGQRGHGMPISTSGFIDSTPSQPA